MRARPHLPPHPLTVITGASSGIGAALARHFSSSGHRVVLLARREDRLREITDPLCEAAYYSVDLADPEATTAVCEQILNAHGTPDIIINNAGAGQFLSIEETSPSQAHTQMALPYFAAFHVTRGFIEPMLARGSGIIFQINSPVAEIAWPGAVGYAAARGALRSFTKALRQDLDGTGVVVGSLTPTRVHSEYFEANPGSQSRVPRVEALVGTMTPDEVAAVVGRAVRTRPSSDSHAPWRWALTQPIAQAVPAPFEWLFRATGHSRRRRRHS